MTPREKAIELVEKFEIYDSEEGWLISRDIAKICADVTVDEILTNFEGLQKPEYTAFDAIGDRKFTFEGEYKTHMTGYDMEEYWSQVKLEIEKV